MLVPSLILLAMAGPGGALAAGEALPHLEGEYLTGEGARIPEDALGNVTLLVMGFSYDARKVVEEWKTAFDHGVAGAPKVESMELMMIGPTNRLNRLYVVEGMKRGTSKAALRAVFVVFGPVEEWKRRVNYHAPNDAYAVLIDRRGVVRGLYHGRPQGAGRGGFEQAVRLAKQLSREP